jgi:5-methylcytosine-specific restriction endonuclease McrA
MSEFIDECSHARVTRPRARTIANGSIQYRRQCLDCGEPVGNLVGKSMALGQTDGHPLAFDETFFADKQKYFEQCRREQREAESDAWWAWYDVYLGSTEWAAKRRKVLDRCAGLCEGCREQEAAHVHHLTYEHVGAELLFELVGLCEICHQATHKDGPNPVPASIKILEVMNRIEADRVHER